MIKRTCSHETVQRQIAKLLPFIQNRETSVMSDETSVCVYTSSRRVLYTARKRPNVAADMWDVEYAGGLFIDSMGV